MDFKGIQKKSPKSDALRSTARCPAPSPGGSALTELRVLTLPPRASRRRTRTPRSSCYTEQLSRHNKGEIRMETKSHRSEIPRNLRSSRQPPIGHVLKHKLLWILSKRSGDLELLQNQSASQAQPCLGSPVQRPQCQAQRTSNRISCSTVTCLFLREGSHIQNQFSDALLTCI